MNDKIYLPGLNGIRAIAALSVVFSHINNRLDYYKLPKSELLDLANFGVTVFFTLSGFLITYLLLKEIEKTGSIDIKKFYMRRVLRIWPLYYLYLFIVVFLNGIENLQWPILFYIFILPNFKNSFAGVIATVVGSRNLLLMIGHYWSLGVEEQFYAFWPWMVRKTEILFRFLVFFPIFYIILKVSLKVLDAPYGLLTFLHYTRFGCLTIGALGAYLFYHNSTKVKWIISKWWLEAFAWLLFLVVAMNKFHLASVIDHEIISIVTLIIIFNQIANPKRLISLENKTFDYLGKISFGLYVYNPLVIYGMSFLMNKLDIENQLLKQITIYVTVVLAIVLVAHLSYYYFEKRFLKIKLQYTTVPSVASKSEFIN
ncbi:acyltransferase [Flavobacterium sp.]|uniref:acyltransferase family protein n=1 Tax=Flavobacterium sp. TaxID=239 RepID=UPI00286C316C|nr:acyltransferase [Flavobacterium sp.]